MQATLRKLIAATALLGAAGAVQADDRNPLDTALTLDVGWFLLSTDMRVRVDGENTSETGSDVDFEDTFGIGDFDRFRGEVAWRFAPRHVVRAMYFENNRDATRQLDRQVTFGDTTFNVGATVKATSEVTVAQLSYEYAFMRRDKFELAGGVGIHYVNVGLALDGTLSVQGGGTISGERKADADTAAPLPVLGIRGLWALPWNLYLTAQAQYFHLDFEEYEGSLTDLKATLVWQFADHVGVGLGYNDFGFKFDIEDRRNFDGRLRWNYGGLMAFASVAF
jgi:hypothetical protein